MLISPYLNITNDYQLNFNNCCFDYSHSHQQLRHAKKCFFEVNLIFVWHQALSFSIALVLSKTRQLESKLNCFPCRARAFLHRTALMNCYWRRRCMRFDFAAKQSHSIESFLLMLHLIDDRGNFSSLLSSHYCWLLEAIYFGAFYKSTLGMD